jgi:hypothetical protein
MEGHKMNFYSDLRKAKRRDRVRNLPALVLTFVLGAFALTGRAQRVGPITPGPSQAPQAPQQAPLPETETRTSGENAKSSLAGFWKLNRDESDDPRQKLEQASKGGGGGWGQGPSTGGGGGWGGWGGGPWGGWGGRGGGSNRSGRPMPDESTVDMSDFSQLTIEQSDSSAKVTGAMGRVLAQYISDQSSDKNDQKAAKKSKDDPNAPPVAKWQGDELVTVVNGPRGVRTTRIYELSPNGKQLYVTTRLDNPRLNQLVNIRFVYDPGSARN